jgi:DNA-binding CsgD family transcriptional regulator
MSDTDKPMLTKRERQVVVLIGQDMKYKDIAKKLGLGYETVKTYAARIRKKLNLGTKVAVALWAERNIPKEEELSDVG